MSICWQHAPRIRPANLGSPLRTQVPASHAQPIPGIDPRGVGETIPVNPLWSVLTSTQLMWTSPRQVVSLNALQAQFRQREVMAAAQSASTQVPNNNYTSQCICPSCRSTDCVVCGR